MRVLSSGPWPSLIGKVGVVKKVNDTQHFPIGVEFAPSELWYTPAPWESRVYWLKPEELEVANGRAC